MSRAAKRHQKKVARKATLKRRGAPARAARPAPRAAPADYLSGLTDQGLQHHSAGRLAEAEAIYRQVLQAKPGHAEANHRLGGLAHQRANHEEAVALIGKAVAKSPKHPVYRTDLGTALQAAGRLDEAGASFRKAVALDPNHAEAHNNLGNLLAVQGRFADAAESCRRATAINPDYAEAHFNLGAALKALGRVADAVASYAAAAAIAPDFIEAHNNRGNALRDLGRLADAAASFERALAIDPGYAEAHGNLGAVLHLLGRGEEALAHCRRAIALKPEIDVFWNGFHACVEAARFATADPSLLDDLQRLLARPGLRASSLVGPILGALRHDPAFSGILALAPRGGRTAPFAVGEVARRLAAMPLFLDLIAQSHVNDLEVEHLLIVLRRALLEAAETLDDTALAFVSALALHCFTNEYLFPESEAERAAVDLLAERLGVLAEMNGAVPPAGLAVLAAYRRLDSFLWAAALLDRDWPEALRAVLARQIVEPMEEHALRAQIAQLTPIDDAVSQAVRAQYEANPYPRWIKADIEPQPRSIEAVLRGSPFCFDPGECVSVERPEILVAGCGTGQHALIPASRFANAHVLAIDLSLASLSYAARKTRALGVDNIEYAQADIAQLGDLGRRFDLIECSGVLHHMGDPMAGWRILVDLLRPGGFMKIGLYSEAARQPVVRARELIEDEGYTASPGDIRRCREAIVALSEYPGSAVGRLVEFRDFYSLSECRDLIFHVQEHRFTLPRIEAALDELELSFLGFEMRDQGIMRAFAAAHPQAAARSLAAWHAFECANPETFRGMYQFWCRKA